MLNTIRINFRNLIKEKMDQDNKTLYILKGFDDYEFEQFKFEKLLNLDLKKLNSVNLQDELQNVITKINTENSFTISYEEMCLCYSAINGILQTFQYKLVIIDNNLFHHIYPLPSVFNEEAVKNGVESSYENIYKRLFDDYFVIDGHTFISYQAMEQYEAFKNVPLFMTNGKKIEYCDDSAATFQSFGITDETYTTLLVHILLEENNASVLIGVDAGEEAMPSWQMNSIEILNQFGFQIRLIKRNLHKVYDPRISKYEEILKRKNESYLFRDILFFKNPGYSLDTVNVSQGEIISCIVNNAELAASSKSFHDIFVTAPTGSGKSVLFQIPAIYLAENRQLLTIVVTPLIGLMNDQVKNIQDMTDCAATINSEYTPEEKDTIKYNIQNGTISVLYVSPETILSNGNITNLIGSRNIGLLVVDEAHIVSTWGKSFRPDYWYLGDYLSNLRTKYGYTFPIAAFSATVTYGGEDDMHADIIESLKMRTGEFEFIAPMRRDDIHFDIRKHATPSDYKEEKEKTVKNSLNELLRNNVKTIAYFPFKSQVQHYRSLLKSDKIDIYHGGTDLTREMKAKTANAFSDGKLQMILATKAFGMGIDVPDIEAVYHFAPTGNLCDYVQEIGRAARMPGMTGIAITDYFDSDERYVKQLYGISSIRNYQVVETLKKIAGIYKAKGKRNFSISPDDFSYIFANATDMSAVENALKMTMLIIQKDFEMDPKLNFPPLIFRPESMFADAYVMVEKDDQAKLQKSYYSRYFTLFKTAEQLAAKYTATKDYYHKNYETGEVTKETGSIPTSITFQGDIYIAHLRSMWEENFDSLSFSQFKYRFFSGLLPEMSFSGGMKNEYILTVTATDGIFSDIKMQLVTILKEFSEAFTASDLRESTFDIEDIANTLLKSGDFKMTPTELAVVSENIIKILNNFGKINMNFGKPNVVFKRNTNTGKYTLSSVGILSERIKSINLEFSHEFDNVLEASRRSFLIPISKVSTSKQILIAQLLEMLHFASYEVISGERPEYFVRVNSIYAIERITKANDYHSPMVSLSWKKHQESIHIMEKFFEELETDKERWDYIEKYFIGESL